MTAGGAFGPDGAGMGKRGEVLATILGHGVLPLYYSDDPGISEEILAALYEGGIRAVEYADRGPTALRNFERLRRVCDERLPGCHLGIGTIKDGDSARAYLDRGADFIVCPGLVESVADAVSGIDLLWVPGCVTPTEILRAEQLGAALVKLYPLNSLGPPYLEAILAVFPNLPFMPTGGIEMDDSTVTAWIRARAAALGGSKLITAAIVEERAWDRLAEDTRRALAVIRSARARVAAGAD